MSVFVCIKQVPDTETKIKLNAGSSGIETNGIKWVMNPYDEFAVEEAIKFRDTHPGTQIIAITVGPKARAGEVLRTALAMGADEGVLVDAPENLDPAQTAKILAAAIAQEGAAELILCGKMAIDDQANSVPQMLAENLKLPHTSVISKFSESGGVAEVERDTEAGAKEVVAVTLPAVFAANKGLNTPRYASLPGIMKAKKKVLKELSAATLCPDLTAAVTLSKYSLPAEKPAAQIIPGDPAAQVKALVQKLRDEAKVL